MPKNTKDPIVAQKIHQISSKLNDLNDIGKVKCGRQNNFGHATLMKFHPGFSFRVHHMFNNTLSLDLLVSPKALRKYDTKCELMISKYKAIAGSQSNEDKNFIIPSRKTQPHYQQFPLLM